MSTAKPGGRADAPARALVPATGRVGLRALSEGRAARSRAPARPDAAAPTPRPGPVHLAAHPRRWAPKLGGSDPPGSPDPRQPRGLGARPRLLGRSEAQILTVPDLPAPRAPDLSPSRAPRPASTCCGPAGARRSPVARTPRVAGSGDHAPPPTPTTPGPLSRPDRAVTWVALRSAVAAPVAVAISSPLRHGAPMTRPESRSALSLGFAPAGPPPPGPAAQTGERRPTRAWGGDGGCWPDAAGARRAPWRAGAASQAPRRTRSVLESRAAGPSPTPRSNERDERCGGGVGALCSPLNSEAARSVSAPC